MEQNKVAILTDKENVATICNWFNIAGIHHNYSPSGDTGLYFHFPAFRGAWLLAHTSNELQPGYTLAKDFGEFLQLVDGKDKNALPYEKLKSSFKKKEALKDQLISAMSEQMNLMSQSMIHGAIGKRAERMDELTATIKELRKQLGI